MESLRMYWFHAFPFPYQYHLNHSCRKRLHQFYNEIYLCVKIWEHLSQPLCTSLHGFSQKLCQLCTDAVSGEDKSHVKTDSTDNQSPCLVPCSLIKKNIFDLVKQDQSLLQAHKGHVFNENTNRDPLKWVMGIKQALDFDHRELGGGKKGYTY